MIGTVFVTPVRSVRYIGILIESDASIRTHKAKTVSSWLAILYRFRRIRRSVTQPVLQSLVLLPVLTRVDYGSTTLAPAPTASRSDSFRRQSCVSTCVRSPEVRLSLCHFAVARARPPLAVDPERITCRLAVLAFRCQHSLKSTAPACVASELQRVADLE